MNKSKIRNFCIIAHIDHGKSTLADRLLEDTKTLSKKDMQNQVLDSMDLERERGITIKSHPIQIQYKHTDNELYVLNLIDTPGHVDFSYEVSRSLAACEGALLVIDAAQGVEAQTVSNTYLAIENNLQIIPIINKVDLPSAQIENVTQQLIELIGCDKEEIIHASAKNGEGVDFIFDAIVNKIPPPIEKIESAPRALIFDSTYDNYRGAIPYVRVVDGILKAGSTAKFFGHNHEYEITEVGHFIMKMVKANELKSGDVGYVIANIRDVSHILPGDTLTTNQNKSKEPLPGFKHIKPMVFSGLYPSDSDDYNQLRNSLDKLKLNDASLIYEPETSEALGFGFRCGFLGLLHMEIIQERLEREFEVNLVTTTPNARYLVVTKDGSEIEVDTPAKMPASSHIDDIKEPYMSCEIVTPTEYIGNIMKLCQGKRGIYKNTNYLTKDKAQLHYDLPLAEIIFDFYDKLKSISRGYASFDYTLSDYRDGKLMKLDILLNGDVVDALSIITHADDAYDRGVALCSKLKELIPRQLFDVPIQASLGTKIIARSTVKALKKNVTAKCYGGDITRKRKLWEKQKQGKKRMKSIGKIAIPQEALLAVLQIDK
ncbi:MAG: translation elongation factor 4 [Candidatus Neomarinimicrobiota bacterium]|nr:elongation factor 4 [Candidatus Neomarinimicrobiota bacterium]MEC7935483.1 translation elongation factor 4 [Candidatus Neomarinimicrobiota bacterium]MEC9027191.1 translation elongation factor 4 [Candidatus Neomarinimicrobiota bacterium]MED5256321.1 translation elongation factor 4 [Candidatus Neomarinimicrobiota bacterium]|tara:strand:+ start:867 stop:2666 length:1800 start_codon:yes stop_codon:yes gene_type:complete